VGDSHAERFKRRTNRLIDIRFIPFTQWNDKTSTKPRTGTFQATHKQILEHLDTELRYLDATQVVISTGHEAGKIRDDGQPKSSASKPWHPGVKLAFQSKRGSLLFTCATYSDWLSNLRAIALTLEGLRAVDKYGATKGGEQYRGFVVASAEKGNRANRPEKEPKAPRQDPPPRSPREKAAKIILSMAGQEATDAAIQELLAGGEALQRAYRAAALVVHPDTGGSGERFHALTAAMELLRGGQ